jgi:hypothetical protein
MYHTKLLFVVEHINILPNLQDTSKKTLGRVTRLGGACMLFGHAGRTHESRWHSGWRGQGEESELML